MDRHQVQSSVNNFFETRLKNDPTKMRELFAENATVRLAGAEDASAIAQQGQDKASVESITNYLIQTWKWLHLEPLSTLIEGNSAVVRYRVTTQHVPSGTNVVAESLDEFHFDKDHKIRELIEFVDTAMAERLEEAANAP